MNYSKEIIKRFVLIVLTVFLALQCFSQLNTNSPYSRFGIGELEPHSSIFGSSNSGAVVSRNPFFSVNSSNPASYSSLIHPTFQTGVTISNYELSNGEETNRNYLTKLNEISVGLPFGKGFAAAFGALPYSSAGYELAELGEPLSDGTPVVFNYSGSGGLTNGFLGFSYRKNNIADKEVFNSKGLLVDTVKYLASSISGGINGNLLFGDIAYKRNVTYLSTDYYQRMESTNLSLADGSLTFGVLYTKNLKSEYISYKNESVKQKNWDLTLGLAYSPEHKSSPNYSKLVGFGSYNLTIQESIFQDTISYVNSENGEIVIPALLEVGATLSLENSDSRELNLTFQYSMQDWSKYKNSVNEGMDEGLLGNSSSIRVALEYTPKPLNETNIPWYKKTLYQIGARTGTSYLSLGGESFTESSVSLGVSVPILGSRTLSRINLGMDFGYRGSTVEGLIEQTSLNTYIGISLMPDMKRNGWFRRSKYQ